MKSKYSSHAKFLILFVMAIMLYSQSQAQLSRRQIVDEKKALARKSEKNIVLINTAVVNSLMQKCIELGIENAQLVFTRIRSIDVDEYVTNHPEAKGYEKDMIGKLTVLIKIEGDNIDENTFISNGGADPNGVIKSMSKAGFLQVKKPYGMPLLLKALYFEVGSICPPPSSCN